MSLPDPVENQGSGVRGDIVASSLKGETESHQDNHAEEALWSTPDIDDLGECNLEETRDEISGDIGGWSQAVRVESGGDPWRQETSGSLLHGIDEVDDEDPVKNMSVFVSKRLNRPDNNLHGVCQDKISLGPGHSDGLHLLNTRLSILGDLFVIESILGLDGVDLNSSTVSSLLVLRSVGLSDLQVRARNVLLGLEHLSLSLTSQWRVLVKPQHDG